MKRVIQVVLSSVALIGAPSVASADWTADIRFNYALTSDAGGSDQDVGDDNEIATFNGDGIEGETGFGFAVGKRFDDIGVSIAYEAMGATYDLSGSVQADGDIFLPGTESDFDVDTFMLEIDYTAKINEDFIVAYSSGKVIKVNNTDDNLMVTAAKNPDQTIAVVVFNQTQEAKSIHLVLNDKSVDISISPQAIQTITIPSIQ